jgi:integrase
VPAPRFKPVRVEQSIRQVGEGKWEIRVFAGRDPVTKKTRHVSRTTTEGVKAAQKLKARLITEVEDGLHVVEVPQEPVEVELPMTFGELLDEWMTNRKKRGRAVTTLNGYRVNIEATIRPALGSVELAKLTQRDLDSFYDGLLDNGVTPATIMHHHRIISAALTQAEKWDYVVTNVARKASPPEVRKKEIKSPPSDRVRDLIGAAEASSRPEMATIMTIAALTGMRRGELCGLRWSDIDWDERSLMVRRSIWQTSRDWGVKDPKTHQNRQVFLADRTVAVLKARLQRALGLAAQAEVRLSEDAYVFSPEVDGLRPAYPDWVSRWCHKLCQELEAPAVERAKAEHRQLREKEKWDYSFHGLRHYAATELSRAGATPVTTGGRLGHAGNGSFTLANYVHNTDDQAIAAAALLEAELFGELAEVVDMDNDIVDAEVVEDELPGELEAG